MNIATNERAQQRSAALTAGIVLIVMGLAAFFAYGYTHGMLVDLGDPAATLNNLMSSVLLFKLEIIGWLVVLICDIIVAWALYVYLKPFHQSLALLGAWFRLIYTAILAMAVLHLVTASTLTDSEASIRPVLETDPLQGQVMTALTAFESAWSFGLIVFGGHLLLIGWVAYRAAAIPRWIGVLLLIAALSYIVTHLITFISPGENQALGILIGVLTIPMTVGELGFGVWLLIKGGRSAS